MKGAVVDGALFAFTRVVVRLESITPSGLTRESWRIQLPLLRCSSYGCLDRISWTLANSSWNRGLTTRSNSASNWEKWPNTTGRRY